MLILFKITFINKIFFPNSLHRESNPGFQRGRRVSYPLDHVDFSIIMKFISIKIQIKKVKLIFQKWV